MMFFSLAFMIMHLFRRKTARVTTFFLLYVHDMIIINDDFEGIQALKISLAQCIEMKNLGPLILQALKILV